jgi:hypothetical protein
MEDVLDRWLTDEDGEELATTLIGVRSAADPSQRDSNDDRYVFMAASIETAIRWLVKNTDRRSLFGAIYQELGVDGGKIKAAVDKADRAGRRTPSPEVGGDPVVEGRKRRRREATQRRKTVQSVLGDIQIGDDEGLDGEDFIADHETAFAYLGKTKGVKGNTKLALEMVQNAASIASKDALRVWRTILAHVRRNPTMVAQPKQLAPPSTMMEGASTTEVEFQLQLAFRKVSSMDAGGLLHDVAHRYGLAHLYSCYRQAETAILPEMRATGQQGVDGRSRVKRRLFDRLYADLASPSCQVTSPYMADSEEGTRAWRAFGKLLEKGKAWFTLRDQLGPGVLALIPSAIVSNTWLERRTNDEMHAWIVLIREFFKPNLALCDNVGDSVHRVLRGEVVSHTPLLLETMAEDAFNELEMTDFAGLLQPAGLPGGRHTVQEALSQRTTAQRTQQAPRTADKIDLTGIEELTTTDEELD